MIQQFQGKYRFLSNFWYVPITYEGITYPTVEHAYQAAKTTDVTMRQRIASLVAPGLSKSYGRRLVLRDNWDQIKDSIMLDLLRLKFKNKELRTMLLATGTKELQEGNMWKDTYWGIDLRTGEGQNKLGNLLMQVREEIRHEAIN